MAWVMDIHSTKKDQLLWNKFEVNERTRLCYRHPFGSIKKIEDYVELTASGLDKNIMNRYEVSKAIYTDYTAQQFPPLS